MNALAKLIGDKIRALRKAQGLSQGKLGEKAGFDYRYIGFIEQARVNPSMKTLGKVASALNVTITELMPTGEEIEGRNKKVPPKKAEYDRILSKIMKHLNKVDNKALKKVEKLVRISVKE